MNIIKAILNWWRGSSEAAQPPLIIAAQPRDTAHVSRPMRRLRREVYESASEILDLFERSTASKTIASGTYVEAHADLLNCDFHYIDELAEKTEGGSRYYLMDDQKEQADIIWPVDIAGIAYKPDKEGYFVSRTATTQPSDVRGKTIIVPPRMLTLTGGMLFDDGKNWWAETTICGLINGQWKDIGNRVIAQRRSGAGTNVSDQMIMRAPGDSDEINMTCKVSLAMALTERYSWHVAFGSEPGPRLLLPTNPGGCLSLFRDREKNDAKNRRDALRHWVSNHYRDTSQSDADLIYVRDHLRGATNFRWRGLDCEIMVSQFDLEKNDFFRLQAAAWRAQRKHNRIRLRVKERKTA